MTIGRHLVLGFLALFVLSGIAVSIALVAARDVNGALSQAAKRTEEGRRLARVAGLFREYYMHQAHLALGMHRAEHLDELRRARRMLGEALQEMRAERLQGELARLDQLLDEHFLPALIAGATEEVLRVHGEVVQIIQRLAKELEADQQRIAAEITSANHITTIRAHEATLLSTAALVAALFLGLGIAFWMDRTISAPVARLEDAARALADAPDGLRVPESGPAEVAALGRTLNLMLDDLDRQRRARSEAEMLAAVGRIAAGIAHEINNPLSVILGNARMLEKAGGEGVEEAAAISQEARLCQAIVRDLLDYARPGARRSELLDLREVVAGGADRAPRKGEDPSEVVVGVPASPLLVRGDRLRLEQLVGNLVRNALAFGESVRLELGEAPGEAAAPGALLVVRDDGAGVPPDDLERVFEPFFSTRGEGSGLGLAIARGVATTHDGTLRALPGPGGHFELWLPTAAEDGPWPAS